MSKGEEIEEHEREALKNINDEIEKTAFHLAEMVIQEAKEIEQKLLPEAAEKEKARLEFVKTLQRSKQTLETGVQELFKALSLLAKNDAKIFTSKLGKDLGELVQFCAAIDEEEELLEYADAVLQDEAIQDLCDISHETLMHFYNAAAYLYSREQYEQALSVFSILILLNPKHALFWLGSGNAAYFLHQYPVAIQAYNMCAITNPYELRCHLYASRCHEALGDFDQAIHSLDLGLIAILDQAVEPHVRDEIEKERVRLESKKAKIKE